MRKWTSVDTTWDVVSAYTLCWGASWLVCLPLVLLSSGYRLAFYLYDHLALVMVATLLGGFVLAVSFGLLSAGFYLGIMRITAKLWYADRHKTNLCSTVAVGLLGFSQLLLIVSLTSHPKVAAALPFAVADLAAAFVTFPFLRKMLR